MTRKDRVTTANYRDPDHLANRLAVYVLVGNEGPSGRDPLTIARQALAGGATTIQLRCKNRPAGEQIALGRSLAQLCRRAGALFIVNDRLDIALAVGADGVHLGQDDLPVTAARHVGGPTLVIGCSVETAAEARAAAADGADYLGIGPIYATVSKADAGTAVGPSHLQTIAAVTDLPLVGIGGIDHRGAPAVIAAGAQGVAVINAVGGAADVTAAAAQLAAAIEGAKAARAAGDRYPGGEFGLIDRLAHLLPAPRTAVLGIGDDAALLPGPTDEPAWAMACDLLVEDIHFRRQYTTPAQLGWKSLAVNVSDMGAMGAVPRWAVVGLAVPPTWRGSAIEQLYTGLAAAARHWQVDIVGGDTTRASAGLTISITVVGELAGQPVLRRGARPGDLIGVTGEVGAAAAGLALLTATGRPQLETAGTAPWAAAVEQAWLQPHPPVAAGARLAAANLVTAMIDVSDGLAADLHHLMAAGGVGAVIESARLPIGAATRAAATYLNVDVHDWALGGGEDFQLLFTFPPTAASEIEQLMADIGVQWSVIGVITKESGAWQTTGSGKRQPLHPHGWDHFRKETDATKKPE